MHFDDRYHHNLWYPDVGWTLGVAPEGAISIVFGDGRFLFNGGVWFHPVGPRWVVVTPPVGIIAPMLQEERHQRIRALLASAELVTTEMVLFEWLRSAESDAFREIQALIK